MPTISGDLTLRGGDVGVPRADDDVDGPDGLGAVRERGDRLRAADAVHLVDAGECGSGQRRRGDCAVGTGRDAQRDLGTPATGAGIAVISTVDGYAARPPGT